MKLPELQISRNNLKIEEKKTLFISFIILSLLLDKLLILKPILFNGNKLIWSQKYNYKRSDSYI